MKCKIKKIIRTLLHGVAIEGHEYYEIFPNVLQCQDCGYYSWNGGEGYTLPKQIKE